MLFVVHCLMCVVCCWLVLFVLCCLLSVVRSLFFVFRQLLIRVSCVLFVLCALLLVADRVLIVVVVRCSLFVAR